jgi:hypothetical protein
LQHPKKQCAVGIIFLQTRQQNGEKGHASHVEDISGNRDNTTTGEKPQATRLCVHKVQRSNFLP